MWQGTFIDNGRIQLINWTYSRAREASEQSIWKGRVLSVPITLARVGVVPWIHFAVAIENTVFIAFNLIAQFFSENYSSRCAFNAFIDAGWNVVYMPITAVFFAIIAPFYLLVDPEQYFRDSLKNVEAFYTSRDDHNKRAQEWNDTFFIKLHKLIPNAQDHAEFLQDVQELGIRTSTQIKDDDQNLAWNKFLKEAANKYHLNDKQISDATHFLQHSLNNHEAIQALYDRVRKIRYNIF